MHSVPSGCINEATDSFGLLRRTHPAEAGDHPARVSDYQIDDISEIAGKECDDRVDVVDVLREGTYPPWSRRLKVTSRTSRSAVQRVGVMMATYRKSKRKESIGRRRAVRFKKR